MPPTYDAIVVGLGVIGSSVLRAVARRGWRTLGIDRFAPPHAMGSSHGRTRFIREAYFEHPSYVPIVQRAYRLWDEIGRDAGTPLLAETGGLMIGPPDGVLVRGALESARVHGLPHEVLEPAEVARRFPAYRLADGMVAVWEPRAGVLQAEPGIAALLAGARDHGAAVRTDEAVVQWAADGDGFTVRTSKGRYTAAHLVLVAGAWLDRLVPELSLPLGVERTLLFWFDPVNAATLGADRCPISIWEHAPQRYFYTFPLDDQGLKAARHHDGDVADPETLDRTVTASEAAALQALLGRFVPDAAGPLKAAAACMYTNTPDGDFILDRHPIHERAVIVSACSGHGFKFAPAIGEIVSDLLVERWTRFDVGRFALSRFERAGRGEGG